MALVLLRSGLGLNLRTARSYGLSFLAFVTLPSLADSILGAVVARALFGMPLLLAWALGWMVAAVGPGVVSAGCAAVKERGYAPRAPNFLMTSMCFDDGACVRVLRLRLRLHRHVMRQRQR
jgi:NhaP-type Na+/H+ or K+/H+ antiporter